MFFDNAGGSLRLSAAEKRFFEVDSIPDCSEHSNRVAKQLDAMEKQGLQDIQKVIFGASSGVIYPSYSASQIMMETVRVISENVSGTNYVTTILEHPSSYDAIQYYSAARHCEMRTAGINEKTGGIDADEILRLIDKNTAVLSCMAASNFSGAVLDTAEIFSAARKINPDIVIICDAVQHAPHGVLDPEALSVDVMNFAPYKFFGVRGFGVAYLSDRVASFMHHRLLEKDPRDWNIGSPAPAHYASISEIINYVTELGQKGLPDGADKRMLFTAGMERISRQERALLGTILEGTDNTPGLRHIRGIRVKMDEAPLSKRDFIIGIEFDRLYCNQVRDEYEKRGVIVFERSSKSIYSKRMVDAIHSKGVVRISPLHVNTVEEIERFLHVSEEIAGLQ